MTASEGAQRLPRFFRQPLSRLQAVIGITAGVISIAGMLYSTTRHYVKPPALQGDIVAVIQEAPSGKPVLDATVEIYTPQNRLVTTLSPKEEGRARQGVNEGPYKLRVSHPKFTPQIKQVQVQPGQTSEVHILLVRPAAPPPPPAIKVAEKKVAEKRATENKVPEKKVTEKKVTEKKVTEKKVTEKKASVKKPTVAKKKVAPAPNRNFDQIQAN